MTRYSLIVAALLAAVPAFAQESGGTDGAMPSRIMDEGLNHSQVLLTAQHLTDVIGPRLTNSPQMRQAEAWTLAKFTEWGLNNVHKEGFRFGRGWWIARSDVRMLTPRPIQLTAIPIAWTPATPGTITAPVIVAPIGQRSHFDAWRGKLAGRIVMISLPGEVDEQTRPGFSRLSASGIAAKDEYRPAFFDPDAPDGRRLQRQYDLDLANFLKAEGAVAYAVKGRDGKLVQGDGYLFARDGTSPLPGIEIASEDYRRLARLALSGTAPTLEVTSDVRFEDRDINAYNIFAEIPGTDPGAGYVMAGAHLDSWVAGDGAADNAAGSAMVMEAARILSRLGVRPKRTIRFALWSGEEQGMLGSLAYVERHLATRGSSDGSDAGSSFELRWPVRPRPGHGDLSVYFNLDNGSGKVRGIYASRNVRAVPILRDWLAPYNVLGAESVALAAPTGTDHVYMQSVGIPGFQFIQDPLDYELVHHSSVDTFDHLKGDDLRQGSTVLAGVLLAAANADSALPRLPLPSKPSPSEPFLYNYPNRY